MIQPIHIEGMGVIGSVLAWTLYECGQAFTWHDTEHAACAWPACTGSIVPSGAIIDQAGYRAWERWADAPPWPQSAASGPIIERADYWFSSKRAPAGAPEAPDRDIGTLRRYPRPSLHVNAPELVWTTRQAFALLRLPGPPVGAPVVVAHGYSSRMDHVTWGWSCLVDLGIAYDLVGPRRPCVYVQRNRFQVAYAYPCPGTPYWYAGSAHVAQRAPAARPQEVIGAAYMNWLALITGKTGGLVVSARRVGGYMQGWRPVGRETDVALVRRAGNRLLTKPCGSSGVRWAPAVAQAVCDALGIRSRKEAQNGLGD